MIVQESAQGKADESRRYVLILTLEIDDVQRCWRIRNEAELSSQTLQNWIRETGLQIAFPLDKCTICPTKNPLRHKDQTRRMQVDNILCAGQCPNVKIRLVFDKQGQFISDHVGMVISLT